MVIMAECKYFAKYGEHHWYDQHNVGLYRCAWCGKTGHVVED